MSHQLQQHWWVFAFAALLGARSWAEPAVVQRVFQTKCVRCHDETERSGDLVLTSEEGRRDVADRIRHQIQEGAMPPEDSRPLSESERLAMLEWAQDVLRQRDAELTHSDILPSLLLRCAACHGRQAQEGGLDVRTYASLLRGGKSGAVVVPGDAENSRLLKRIHAKEMPPRRKLIAASVKPMPPDEVERLTRWINRGAVQLTQSASRDDSVARPHKRLPWSFRRPYAASVPAPENDSAWEAKTQETAMSPIDAFLLHRMREHHGIDFASFPGMQEADRRTLIRRATLDLLGVPPTLDALQQFINDHRPGAYERMLDRLLSSPKYGERWAQHWLDLAGYSDSEGVQHADKVRPNAYRYRDYVIRAWNADKPYDRFLQEQIAGDELADYASATQIDQSSYDNLVATGFLRMAPDGTYEPLTGFVPDRLELIDDELEVLTSTVLGLTVKCARCHAHKFDPISQEDYFRLAAIFKGALDEHDWLKPTERFLPLVSDAERARAKRRGAGEETLRIRALWDRGDPSPTYLLRRGNYLTPGKQVEPGVPASLELSGHPYRPVPPYEGAEQTGRRLAFARWATHPDHPLTARVFVNRIWAHHFGVGIVPTLDNFGHAGAKPSHPELLDWLTVDFVRHGWQIKRLHRQIMTSAAYRQSSRVTAWRQNNDPDNRFLSRAPMRRLDAETLYDSTLAVAARLNSTLYGPAVELDASPNGLVKQKMGSESHWRRSIYALKRRTQPITMLRAFDAVAMDPNCVRRRESTVVTQALHLKNSRWLHQVAGHFAERVWNAAGEDVEKQVDAAFRMAVSRPPTQSEMEVARRSLRQLTARRLADGFGSRYEVPASSHLWIRESEPQRVFEDDLVSVWSKKSRDNARRWGVIEFDLKRLRDKQITGVKLRLGAINDSAIHQRAAVIPPGIGDISWAKYQQTKQSGEQPLEALGRMQKAKPRLGDLVEGPGGTFSDVQIVAGQLRSTGRLALVLKADEDGKPYRQDWDDGRHKSSRGHAPVLLVSVADASGNQAQRKALHDFCHAILNSAAFLYVD